jgi:glycosyltransferase involved in cell wall biosynthesis
MSVSKNQPRVSLGMPVYNGENFLKQALDSLLSQTFEDFELIVSDNASTDRTEEICREYATRDRRIRYYRQEKNLGAASNFNYVFELSRGEYFKWAAHDDLCAPSFIAECVEVLDPDESVILCYPKTKLINENGDLIGVSYKPLRKINSREPQERFQDILFHAVWCFEVFGLIRADVLRKTPLIEKYYGSDKVLLARLSLLGRFQEIDKYLFFRRCSPKQSTNMIVRDKAVWINPQYSKLIPFQLQALAAYTSAPWKTPLTNLQRLQCFLAVLRLIFKKDKLKKLLLPGTYNYFGINLKRKVR